MLVSHDTTLQDCIRRCLECYSACLGAATGHCLEMGGPHVERGHFTIMLTCAEMCRTAAHMMLLGTPHHRHTCAECVEICEQCAADCERLGGMEDCVAACRACAQSCRQMDA